MKCVAIPVVGVAGLMVSLSSGCGSDPMEPPAAPTSSIESARAAGPEGSSVDPATEPTEPTESAEPPAPAAAPTPEPAGPPKKLLAKKFVANIRSAPSKGASKLGYLRAGAITLAKTAEPVGFERCRKGWFELTTGGFVCSTVDVIAYSGRRPQERLATQPDLDARLPYPYGYCRRTGTPMFKRLPTKEEAEQFDPKPAPAPSPTTADGGVGAGLPTRPVAATGGAEATEPNLLAGSPGPLAGSRGPLAGSRGPLAGNPDDQGGQTAQPPSSASAEPEVSTLASLLGDPKSVLARRMERGFYVSLDRDMRRGGRRYWRTQANGFIPYRRIVPVRGSAFEGLVLPQQADAMAEVNDAAGGRKADGPDAAVGDAAVVAIPAVGWDPDHLPVAFVMSRRARVYRLDARGRLRKGRPAGYHHRFVPRAEVSIGGRRYLRDAEDKLYRVRDVRRVARRAPPPEVDVAAQERWIDVDLTRQTLVAYAGARAVYATLISSGRVKDPEDPLKNFETPTGSYRISSKHLTATMDGDHALDGPYSIEDVPYVMFFHQAYAFHAAFWHNGFGRPRSHGCINLAPADARFVFRFASPELPKPWHGAYPTEAQQGTRVFIHGETPEG